MASAATLQRFVLHASPDSQGPGVQRRPPVKHGRVVLRADPYGSEKVIPRRTKIDPGNMLTCMSLDEWASPEASYYQGLRVARSIDPFRWQSVADQLLKDCKGKKDTTLQKQFVSLGAPEALLQNRFQDAARNVSRGLPTALAKLVYEDAQAMADITHKVVPDAQQLTMKLELFAESVCSRWHEDSYVCRSIVSYNCSATQYTANSNVDFQELWYCGNNDCIIRDKSQIRSADVGDIVMIKGAKFPGTAKSLVHKSPEVSYDDNGDVKVRLILKVDVQESEKDRAWQQIQSMFNKMREKEHGRQELGDL